MSQASAMPVLGPLLRSRYALEGELGRGGMGVVYAAIDKESGGRVAIKLIDPPRVGRPRERERQRERLLMEARAAAAVSHPNVVDLLDVGSDGDELFLIMERLEGQTLDAVLHERGSISPALALEWLLPIMDALGALHRAGVVHRDLKPSNIFLAAGSAGVTPKLLDFGLARSADDPRVTSSGQVIGTPAYMAPEHAAGEAVGPAADVWSLGVVFYECVAGRTPFPPLDRSALAMQVLLGRVRPLVSSCPTLPVGFASAVDRALKRDLSQRYRSMPEMARALRGAAEESGLQRGSAPSAHASYHAEARAALRSAPTEPNPRRAPEPVVNTWSPPKARALQRPALYAGCALAVLVAALTLSLRRAHTAGPRAVVTPSAAVVESREAPSTVPLPAVLELYESPEADQQAPAPKTLRSPERRVRARARTEPAAEPKRRRSRSGVETEWL